MPDRRTRSAKVAIGRRRASARIDHKQHDVRLRHRGGGLRLHPAPTGFRARRRSRPAVSITLKERSPSLASPSRRSRVTPGSSSTSARRRPTRRLNRVDLPTFGRPTMATVKDMMQSGAARGKNLGAGAAQRPMITGSRCLVWDWARPVATAAPPAARASWFAAVDWLRSATAMRSAAQHSPQAAAQAIRPQAATERPAGAPCRH